jgi:hypothetical protein
MGQDITAIHLNSDINCFVVTNIIPGTTFIAYAEIFVAVLLYEIIVTEVVGMKRERPRTFFFLSRVLLLSHHTDPTGWLRDLLSLTKIAGTDRTGGALTRRL